MLQVEYDNQGLSPRYSEGSAARTKINMACAAVEAWEFHVLSGWIILIASAGLWGESSRKNKKFDHTNLWFKFGHRSFQFVTRRDVPFRPSIRLPVAVFGKYSQENYFTQTKLWASRIIGSGNFAARQRYSKLKLIYNNFASRARLDSASRRAPHAKIVVLRRSNCYWF